MQVHVLQTFFMNALKHIKQDQRTGKAHNVISVTELKGRFLQNVEHVSA
jgi:hypothetical protein